MQVRRRAGQPATLILAWLALAAVPAAAQGGAVRNASATITAADVARRVGIIADDSMGGRDTPSPGLELTAQYIAGEFRRLGLKPGGDSGTFFQRYPLVRTQLDVAGSRILFQGTDHDIAVSFSDRAVLLFGKPPAAPVTGPLTMIGGVIDTAQIGAGAITGRIVVWALDFTRPTPGAGAVVQRLANLGASALVLLSNRDSQALQGQVARAGEEQVEVAGGGDAPFGGLLILEVHQSAVTDVVPEAAQDIEGTRSAPATVVQPLDDWSGHLDVRRRTLGEVRVPNVIGILEGSDPALRQEYLVYSAHMDHVGTAPGQPDSIFNGADDDASGTAGILELAEAFAARGARPKRSIIFMTVSGEEKGLWGSGWFAEHPTVPMANVVANLNLDMIGRNWKDTIAVIGREHSDLGTTLDRVAAAHRDLNMQPINDPWPEEGLYFRSDHFNFARKGVPVLFFTSGLHEDYHEPSDSPDKIDSEKEARLLRLLFFLGQEVANAPARPQLNPESYKEIMEGGHD